MAIVINSLTPTNPSTQSGSSITFVVDAYDTNGLPLSYTWQFSQDGNTYSSNGLVGNTTSTYTTSNLTINQNGLYFRVAISDGASTIFSNEYPGIGDRIITVFQDPSIVTQVNGLVDYYPTSQIINAGESVTFTASASLSNTDISTASSVQNIIIQWQYSNDDGSTWIGLSDGGDVSIMDVVDTLSTTPLQYYKYSQITYSNVTFSQNLYLYRAVVSFVGAVNTPVNLPNISLLVSPTINVYRNPGEGDDTQTLQAYKTSIPSSGEIKLQVGALTTANTTLSYAWEASLDNNVWTAIGGVRDLLELNNCILKPGTNANSDVLELERFIYYDEVYFRCYITGSSGEDAVYTQSHKVMMTDVEGEIFYTNSDIDAIEDKYGNITNRDFYIDSDIQTTEISFRFDTNRNTGINGRITAVIEKQLPGQSSWDVVGEEYVLDSPVDFVNYTSTPNLLPIPDNFTNITYTTYPLRVDVDDETKFRLKITSSSVYSLAGNVKTLIPYYSDEVTLHVYRTSYITANPSDITVYQNFPSSFAVIASPSSGSESDLSYQWQYNTSNISTGWVDVPLSATYSGTQTNLLIINSSSLSNPYRYYRCIVSISGQLSSVSSTPAFLQIERDFFVGVSSINDQYINEFESLRYEVTASSLSSADITYQWEKSVDYNISTDVGSWTPIVGQNTNIFEILSTSVSDTGFYRLKLTSFGGEILYTNIAYVSIFDLNITVTKNIPSSITALEAEENPYIFECEGFSTTGSLVQYQWEIKRSTDSDFTPIGNGYQNQIDTEKIYYLNALSKDVDNQCKIRCKLFSSSLPSPSYTNECLVTVKRRFLYTASASTITIESGTNLILDLNPSWTGGNPTFSWQENGSFMGETSSSLSIFSIDSSYSGKSYRCQITLDGCDEYLYNIGGNQFIIPASSVDFTVSTIVIVGPSVSKPNYYSLETQKTGAAIGTVICVAKPPNFNRSSSNDDISSWKVAVSGGLTEGSAASSPTTVGGSDDRFFGYLEMRGQYLKAKDFPELARIFGNTYGGNASKIKYPRYDDSDVFRMPLTYGKKLMGTGNVDNNRGSVSVTPEYGPSGGANGADKYVPGSIGGRYNWGIYTQLPPGSPGLGPGDDGLAGIDPYPSTFTLGSYRTTGISDVNAFVQPVFGGTVSYGIGSSGYSFTQTPLHTHSGVVAAWEERAAVHDCYSYQNLTEGKFVETASGDGQLEEAPNFGVGASHNHASLDGYGSFNVVTTGGQTISDTTISLTGQSEQLFNSSLRFYLRNAEDLPINSAYFRLKYLIKAY